MLRFFINLDRSTKRCQALTQRLDELDLSFTRISAVDGKALNEEDCALVQSPIDDPDVRARYTRQLTPAEIGCFLSHRKCWEMLVTSDEDYAVVLEDDLIISDRAVNYLKSADWIPDNVEICRLNCYGDESPRIICNDKIPLSNEDALIVQLKPKPLGSQGYIISKKAAQEALACSEKLPCPVDDFLFTLMFDFAHKFKAWQLNPAVIKAADTVESEIGSRHKKDIAALKAPFMIRHGLKRYRLKHQIKKLISQGVEEQVFFK